MVVGPSTFSGAIGTFRRSHRASSVCRCLLLSSDFGSDIIKNHLDSALQMESIPTHLPGLRKFLVLT